MVRSEARNSPTRHAKAADHKGSASTVLTGRGLLLSWTTSIALHVAGLLVMFYVAFPFASSGGAAPPVTPVELIGDPDGAAMASSDALDRSDEPKQVEPQDVRFTPRRFQPLSELGTIRKSQLSVIGIGTGGGDFSAFGLTAGRGATPQFFGLGASARGAGRIVYVVDRSGSMLDTFVHVREELKRSISALRRGQKFHVIFFNSGVPLENPPKRLVSAIRAQKQAFFSFLGGVFPEGSTHPEQAMRRALGLEPDLVYFLTDGEFDPGLLVKLDRWNQDRSVQIFTIAYFDESGAGLLETIAREHGGKFTFVSDHDLP